MSNVIKFPTRAVKVKKPSPPTEEEIEAALQAKYDRRAKWHQWKDQVRHWGGGHRKPDGSYNHDAIANIEVDKKEWRSLEYRQAMGAEVLRILMSAGVIGLGCNRPGIFQFVRGQWKQLISDRQIKKCLVQNLNFVRGDEVLCPPIWLVETCRFEALRYLDQE
jgi:hypothetical protein